MWACRNAVVGGVVFAERAGRGAKGLHETVGECKGKLQSDGYSAYTAYLKQHADVELVSCLAHIRRKFFDAKKTTASWPSWRCGRSSTCTGSNASAVITTARPTSA